MSLLAPALEHLADAPGAAPPPVVAVREALDLATVARVRASVEDALRSRPSRLVVDLSACPTVDASALAMLVEVHRHMARYGGCLTLRGACPRVLRVLSLTGLRRVFDLD